MRVVVAATTIAATAVAAAGASEAKAEPSVAAAVRAATAVAVAAVEEVPGVGGGGFGGGGGGGQGSRAYYAGGVGGFGGGGGIEAPGGFGAGAGGNSSGGGGGGGLGAGGDVFVQAGASLTVEGTAAIGAGTAMGGTGDDGGAEGQALASGIYLQGNGATLNFDVTANETVAGVIGDDIGSTAAASYAGAAGYLEGKVGIVESGAAILTLSAANTYTGGTTLDSGTLDLTNISGAGTGAITFAPGANATLQIVPNASLQTPANTIDGFAPLDTIDLAGVGLASSDSLDSNNLLTVFFGAAKATLQLNPAASYAGEVFHISSDGSSGTDLTLATDPGPTITAAAPSVVEKSQTTEIATATPGFVGDSLTLHQMTGVGTLSLQLVGGVEEVIYTAPANITTSGTDTVTYTITDADNLTANGTGTITLDAGPTITAVTPSVVRRARRRKSARSRWVSRAIH